MEYRSSGRIGHLKRGPGRWYYWSTVSRITPCGTGEFAEELVSGGLAVLGYDLRGHGRSGGPRVWVRQFNDYLSDLEVAIADGRRRHPEAPLYLFGHSMGGAIATLYAMEHPDRLQGLVVSAPAIRP